jgi:hypothetical protein
VSGTKRSTVIAIGVAALVVVAAVTGLFRMSVRPGYIEDDKKATALEIDRFHARLDVGEFAEIYDKAHPALKSTQNREDLVRAMQASRDRVGRFKFVTYSLINVFVRGPVEARAVYNTTYEKGDFTEQFIFLKDDRTFRLALYSLSPGTVRPSGAGS